MKATTVKNEAAEMGLANMVDDSLVYLSSSNKNMPAMDVVGCSHIAVDTAEDMRLYERPGDTWAEQTLLCGGEAGVRYVLYSGRCVEFAALRRMKALRAVDSSVRSVMRIDKFDITEGGAVKRKSHSAYLLDSRWSFDHEYSLVGAKIKRRTSHTGWEDHAVVEIPVDRIVMPLALLSATLCRKNFWMVNFSVGLPQTLSLPTDAVGVKEWFRMRDVPDGKSRREALLHWVRQHYRQNRLDPEVEHSVRRHVRGARHFNWLDMHCTITPHDDPKRSEPQLVCLQ